MYPSGFADRSDHVGQLDDGPTMAEFDLSEERLLALSDGVVLLSYRAEFRRPHLPDGSHPEVMYVSSLWCRRDGRWVNVFSQDTPSSAAPSIPTVSRSGRQTMTGAPETRAGSAGGLRASPSDPLFQSSQLLVRVSPLTQVSWPSSPRMLSLWSPPSM